MASINEITPSILKITNKRVITTKNLLSLINIFSFVFITNNKVPIAITKPMFATLLPTIFPIINPDSFENEADIEVANSGNEVPIEINVNPITNSLTPIRLANLAECSTKKSEPFIKITNENSLKRQGPQGLA